MTGESQARSLAPSKAMAVKCHDEAQCWSGMHIGVVAMLVVLLIGLLALTLVLENKKRKIEAGEQKQVFVEKREGRIRYVAGGIWWLKSDQEVLT